MADSGGFGTHIPTLGELLPLIQIVTESKLLLHLSAAGVSRKVCWFMLKPHRSTVILTGQFPSWMSTWTIANITILAHD